MAEKKSFLTTTTGVITALAALITAVGGLLIALNTLDIWPRTAPVLPTEATDGAGIGPQAVAPVQGWTIIGFVQSGVFDDMLLLIDTDAPAIGGDYPALANFRLVAERLYQLEAGEQVVTLGRVAKTDRVRVVELFIPGPSSERQPVWAKLEAVLGSFD